MAATTSAARPAFRAIRMIRFADPRVIRFADPQPIQFADPIRIPYAGPSHVRLVNAWAKGGRRAA
jgi:hypothetical protein